MVPMGICNDFTTWIVGIRTFFLERILSGKYLLNITFFIGSWVFKQLGS